MNEIKVFSWRDGKSKKKPFKVLNDIKLAFGMTILGRLNNKIHLYSWRKTGNRGRTVCTGEWRSIKRRRNFRVAISSTCTQSLTYWSPWLLDSTSKTKNKRKITTSPSTLMSLRTTSTEPPPPPKKKSLTSFLIFFSPQHHLFLSIPFSDCECIYPYWSRSIWKEKQTQ